MASGIHMSLDRYMTDPKPNRVAALRKERKLTQQQLADAIGAHWITISKLERGQLKLTFEWVGKIARALNVDIFDLYPEDELSRMAIVTGFVLEKGRIKLFSERDQPISCLVDIGFGEAAGSRWLYVDTYDLVPFLHSGDLIRTEEVIGDQINTVIDRLCFARFEEEREKDIIGIVTRGLDEHHFDIRPFNAPPQVNVRPTSLSRVSMIVLSPRASVMTSGSFAKGRT